MSESRAEALRGLLRTYAYGVFEAGWFDNKGDIGGAWREMQADEHAGQAVARSICEHLGIDWSMVYHVSTIMEQNGVDVPLEYDTIAKGRNVDAGHALTTLLEAAGIER